MQRDRRRRSFWVLLVFVFSEVMRILGRITHKCYPTTKKRTEKAGNRNLQKTLREHFDTMWRNKNIRFTQCSLFCCGSEPNTWGISPLCAGHDLEETSARLSCMYPRILSVIIYTTVYCFSLMKIVLRWALRSDRSAGTSSAAESCDPFQRGYYPRNLMFFGP